MRSVRRSRLPCGLGGLLCGSLALALGATPVRADPARIYAAGSLVAPIKALIAASGLPPTAFDAPVFGPAGLLRQRLEAGEKADLFASADLAQPQRLVETGSGLPVVPFARNTLCVLAKPSLKLTAETLLETLLDPATRLATSTAGADPGGDYALAIFDRAEAIRPGAGKILRGKALSLLGSPGAMVPVAGRSPGASVFLGDHADALLYYCSASPATVTEVPGLVSVPLPPTLEVHPVYGLTVLGSNPDAMRLALFALSKDGQAILVRHGLLPIAGP